MNFGSFIGVIAFCAPLTIGSIGNAWHCNVCNVNHRPEVGCPNGARLCNSCKKVHRAREICPEVALGQRMAGKRFALIAYGITDEQLRRMKPSIDCKEDIGDTSGYYDSDAEKGYLESYDAFGRVMHRFYEEHHGCNAKDEATELKDAVNRTKDKQLLQDLLQAIRDRLKVLDNNG